MSKSSVKERFIAEAAAIIRGDEWDEDQFGKAEDRSAELVAKLIYEWMVMLEGWVFLDGERMEEMFDDLQDSMAGTIKKFTETWEP